MKKFTMLFSMFMMLFMTVSAQTTLTVTADAPQVIKWTQAPSPWGAVDVAATDYPAELNFNFGSVRMAEISADVQAGILQATFDYTSGSHALVILGVDLLDADGNIVAKDYHYGKSGGAKTDHQYKLEIATTGVYTMRIFVNHYSKDNDVTMTNGDITFEYVSGEEVLPTDDVVVYDGPLGNTSRMIKSVTLTSSIANANGNVITLEGTNSWNDHTATDTLRAVAGEEVTLAVALNGGTWMHAYAYIDLDADGILMAKVGGEGAELYAPALDLVTYSGFQIMGSYYNSKGAIDNNNTLDMPSFVVPATPGNYRMRVKTDWCTIDPKGGGEFQSASGVAVDFILCVEEEPKEEPEAVVVTFDFPELYGTSTISDISGMPQTIGDITVSFEKGNSNNNPAYNKAGEVRLYGGKSADVLDGCKLIVTSAGAPIASVVLNAGTIDKWGVLSANVGEIIEDADKNSTWTGEAQSVEFTASRNADNVGTATQNRYKSIVVTTAGKAKPSISAPTLSVQSGVYGEGFTVSLSSEYANVEEGVNPSIKYYYTLNGDEPSAESTRAWGVVRIDESCTLKVIAVMTVGEKTYTSAVSSADYVISEMKPFKAALSAEEIKAGMVFIAADTLAMGLLDEGKTYGYIKPLDIAVNGNYVENLIYYAYTLEEAEGGWYIRTYKGQYLYMTGSYNSFNLSDEVPAEGGVWTIEVAEDGTATITNVEKTKYIQYDANYSSYGAYPEARDGALMPKVYVQGEYPVLTWSPSGEEEQASLKEFTFVCAAGLAIDEEAGIPNLYDPMTYEVDTLTGEYIFPNNWDLDVNVVDDTTVVLSVPAEVGEVTSEGSFYLTVPAGFFILDPNGLAIKSEQVYDAYRIVDMTPMSVVSVTPAQGAVKSLSRIDVVFSHDVTIANWKSLPVLNADGDTVCMANVSDQAADGSWLYDAVGLVLEQEITAQGSYSIVIPDNYIYRTSNNVFFEGTTLQYRIKGMYEPTYTGTRTRADRAITSITLNSAAWEGEEANVLSEISVEQCYVDATATTTMKAAPGETVTLNVAHSGSWIHRYVYIDTEADGFTASIAEDSEWQPAGDLVAYSFYAKTWDTTDEFGYNSVGAEISGGDRNTPVLPEFTVPAEPGTYRVRVKIDWMNIDPDGDSDGRYDDFMQNGGHIVDFMLEVAEAPVEPFGVVDVTPSTEEVVDSLSTIVLTFNSEVASDAFFTEDGKVNELFPSGSDFMLGNAFGTYPAVVYIEGNTLRFVLKQTIYDAGEYTLSIPAGCFVNAANGEKFAGIKCIFTVSGTYTGINAVDAESGDAEIYDLTGRRVEKAVKGVYIINGKKVLVK